VLGPSPLQFIDDCKRQHFGLHTILEFGMKYSSGNHYDFSHFANAASFPRNHSNLRLIYPRKRKSRAGLGQLGIPTPGDKESLGIARQIALGISVGAKIRLGCQVHDPCIVYIIRGQ
jgi:hypothetical protein